MVPTLTPAFIIPEGIGGGISGGGQNVALNAAGVVAAGVIVGGLVAVAAPVVAALAAKASLLTAASPLGLLAVGSFLKGLQQLREWGLLNFRNGGTQTSDAVGVDVLLPTAVDVSFRFKYTAQQRRTNRVTCSTGAGSPDTASTATPNDIAASGIGYVVEATTYARRNECGPGTNIPDNQIVSVRTIKANGTRPQLITRTGGGTSYNATVSDTVQVPIYNIRATYQSVDYAPTTGGPSEAPLEQVRPRLFPQTLPDAPTLPAPPLREPLQTPTLPPPPDRRPLAPPVTIPRPGQDPARVPVPGPRPGPAPGPGPSPTPSQPAPAGVPAIGPLPLPIPLPVPTTPGSVVIVDGQPIGGPGQAPAPNLVAIAQELGRLERKNEILLSRPENGGLGEVAENAILGTLRSLLERLITELLNDVPGGSFSLSHACPPPGGGDPLPPVVVPYSGGGNPTAGILAKLDGLAGLIQAHKTMGQPTCKTAISGDEVTIHFESDF